MKNPSLSWLYSTVAAILGSWQPSCAEETELQNPAFFSCAVNCSTQLGGTCLSPAPAREEEEKRKVKTRTLKPAGMRHPKSSR